MIMLPIYTTDHITTFWRCTRVLIHFTISFGSPQGSLFHRLMQKTNKKKKDGMKDELYSARLPKQSRLDFGSALEYHSDVIFPVFIFVT